MKIILLSPLRSKIDDEIQSSPTFPRIALACIAAVLEEEGHEVAIIDSFIEKYTMDELCTNIAELSPDF
ncbi:MAG: hypothetical protein KAJ19_22510, partial [Gammaproteobacteria bacterium]|nr:hypothetical protein [Gammaproteobacteria bacterium]